MRGSGELAADGGGGGRGPTNPPPTPSCVFQSLQRARGPVAGALAVAPTRRAAAMTAMGRVEWTANSSPATEEDTSDPAGRAPPRGVK